MPGLRPAEPGEFAWRAFVNGKIDLAEVEGLADLVEAETAAQRRQAQRIAGGALSRDVDAIRAKPDRSDGADRSADRFFRRRGCGGFVAGFGQARRAEAAGAHRPPRSPAAAAAERLREGFTVVIAGPPNVGKSTLMNALAGREVAIVSPVAGTTRDLIEVFARSARLSGHPGRHGRHSRSADPIEREGVARARRRAERRGPDAVAERWRRAPIAPGVGSARR